MRVITICVLLASLCACSHRSTCAEIWGEPPRVGYVKRLPAGYKFVHPLALTLDGRVVTGRPDFSVWDEDNRLVCDARGKDVPR